jgi:FkbM family methyltransferase
MTFSVDKLMPAAEAAKAASAGIVGRPDARVAIYGTGFLGRWAAKWLVQQGMNLVACFDGDPAKAGGTVCGVTIHGADEVESIRPDLVFITARHAVGAVSRYLADRAIPHVSFDGYYAAGHLDDFAGVAPLFADERSQHVLQSILMVMLSGDRRYCEEIFEKDQYFCLPRFCGAENETYIDAGAYTGDSIERFLWAHYGVFKEIHAFEPGVRQFQAMSKRIARLSEEWALPQDAIQLNKVGLGAGSATMASATHSGQLQSLQLEMNDSPSDTGVPIQIQSLDAYLDGRRATFIKADVEGMEMALIEGARATIVNFRPKLAICVYHYPSDIHEIAVRLKQLVPEYQMALRHHSPQFMESVLYAWAD